MIFQLILCSIFHDESFSQMRSVSLCFISQCERKHYLMIFNLFLCPIPPLNSNRRTRVGNLQRAKFIDELESSHNDSSGLFSFSFSYWFHKGSVKGSVGGQLTGGQCFVETRFLQFSKLMTWVTDVFAQKNVPKRHYYSAICCRYD